MRKVVPHAIKDNNGILWVGITPQHYQNLAQNLNDLLKLIRTQSSIDNYYINCIARFEEKHNAD